LTLLLAGVSVPFVETISMQVQSMTLYKTPVNKDVYQSVTRVLRAERGILPARKALQLAAYGRVDRTGLEKLRRQDPANGLYSYLQLLALLRQYDRPIHTQPAAGDAELCDLLRRLATGPPVKIYLTRQRDVAEKVFRKAGLSVRRSAFEAYQIQFAVIHLRIVSELADRLIERAGIWWSAGRSDDATAAYNAVLQLLTDLLDESPTPQIALLAAEKLPPVLEGVGAEKQARQLESFERRYSEDCLKDRVNILPRTCGFILARDAHHRTLRSLCAAGLSILTWLTLALICLPMLPAALLFRPPAEEHFEWRRTGMKGLILPLAGSLPLLLLLVVIATADLHFIWLFSSPTLPAILGYIPFMMVIVGLVTRLGIKQSERTHRNRRLIVTICVIVAILLLSVLIVPLLFPLKPDSWRPPAGIQRFRQAGFFVGAVSLVFIVLWLIWLCVRRRCLGLPGSVWAHGLLRVATVTLLFVSVFSLIVSGINHRNDRAHQQAFARASADELADRMGHDWYEKYFQGIRDCIK